MGLSGKYGMVTTERGTIGHDEPVFILRAQDKQAVPAMEAYLGMCDEGGSPAAHLEDVEKAIARFKRWQRDHWTRQPGTGK